MLHCRKRYKFKDRIVYGRGQLDIKYMSSKLEKNGKTYFWELQKVEKYLSETPEISGNLITAFYGAQRSLFHFRTAAFRNETVVYTTVFIQVNGKG